MPTPSGAPSLMDAILAGEKPDFLVCDKEKVMDSGKGIKSPLDGSYHATRKGYEQHLKQNGCHIKDYTLKKRPETEQ